MKRFTMFRVVSGFPAFPENRLGLTVGTQITAAHSRERNLGLEVGQTIPIFYLNGRPCIQRVHWELEELLSEIEDGVWKVEPVPLTGEKFAHAIFHNQNLITPESFWKYAWPNINDLKQGERFMLRHEPGLEPELIRAPAKEMGIFVEIHKKLAAAKTTNDGISMEISAGDEGFLNGEMQLDLQEMLSGDAFCIISVAV